MFKHSCFPLRKNNFPISQTKVEHPAAQHITREAFGLFYFLGQSTEEWIKNFPVFNVLPFLEEKEIFAGRKDLMSNMSLGTHCLSNTAAKY